MSNQITLPPWVATPNGKPFTANAEISGVLGTIDFTGIVYADVLATAQVTQEMRAQAYYNSLLQPAQDLQDHDLAPVPYNQVVGRLAEAEARVATLETAVYTITKGFSDLVNGGTAGVDAAKAALAQLLTTFGQQAVTPPDPTRYSEVRLKH